jgi:peptidyl-prolyl cis-trans isomerase D
MPKENKEITPKIITKKHIARLEKEDRQKKFLLLGLIALLVIVVALVTYGILDNTVLKTKKPVARVNSSVITVEQFQKRVKYERLSLSETFVNYASSQFAQFFQSQLLEVQNKLDDYIQFGSDTLDKMIDEELVAQKAKELGITVSEEEIDKEIERSFGFFPNGTPTPIATVEYKATSTYSPTQLALVTLTPTPTEFPTETPFPLTPTVAITLSGTESAGTPTATEIPPTSTPEVQPTATEIPPTPTEYTRAGFESLYETMVANVGIQTDYNSADFRAFVKNILLSTKVYDYLTKDLKPAQEMVWARQILVQTEPEAKLMLTKLNSG